MSSRIERHNQRKKMEWMLLLGFTLVLVLIVGAFIWGSRLGDGDSLLRLFSSTGGRVNILVLGVDERSDDVGRSDTMLVVSVDSQKQDVDVISIPRDTRVKIPGYGFDKINHAYGEGKHKLSQRTAEQLLGITIQHYLIIDFNGFKRIIDALGGITIDIEKRMYYEDPYDNLVIDLQPGVQTLNGETAIGYVRYRDEEGDIGRIERQQKFVKAVMQKVAQPSIVARIPVLIRELSSAVRTSMSTTEMINLAKVINDGRKQGMQGHMVPGTPAYIADVSYWLPDMVETRKMVAAIMGTTMDEKAVTAARQFAADYEQAIPREMVIVNPVKTDTKTTKDALPIKPGVKTDTQKQDPNPTKIRVQVINASGTDEAGIKMVSELKKQGFEVVSVSQAATQERMTTVVEHTGTDAIIKRVSSLPFDYNLSLLKDGGKSAEITVVIGKNYK